MNMNIIKEWDESEAPVKICEECLNQDFNIKINDYYNEVYAKCSCCGQITLVNDQ